MLTRLGILSALRVVVHYLSILLYEHGEISNPQVISEDVGMSLDKVDINALGRAKKATVSKDDTILLHGYGDKDQIEDRNEQLRQAIGASTSDYDRSALRRTIS